VRAPLSNIARVSNIFGIYKNTEFKSKAKESVSRKIKIQYAVI
jgi:hypothetical protein